jgi:putative molybdopterin biosynthesis protein
MGTTSFYLNDIPLSQAKQAIDAALQRWGCRSPLAAEVVPLSQALGRVTAEPVWALQSSPHYNAAAMDGYALRASDTQEASDLNPVDLVIGEQAAYVDTGDPIPPWSDAVVPIEDVEPVGLKDARGQALETIRLRAGLTPWRYIRSMGEDLVATELVIPAGQVLRPVDLGAIAGSGHDVVSVVRRPKVAILPTGDELVDISQRPEPGEIIEFNSLVLAGQVDNWGGVATRLPRVGDDPDAIANTLRRACESHDLVLVVAGSSAGSEDFTASVIDTLGELIFHGVAVRPGHPVVFGMVPTGRQGSATPVLGVPGYPVSAALTGEIFLAPLLAQWQGRPVDEPETLEAEMGQKVHSTMGDDEYLRVVVGEVGGHFVAGPLGRGAGVISSLVRADGVLVIHAGTQGIEAGEKVEIRLYRRRSEIQRALLAQGSHDLTLDLICQELAVRGQRLTSTNVGSLGGLIALRRGYAHLAGCHLIDPETGEYNIGYVRRYIPNQEIVLLGLVNRVQGLVVQPGNPCRIESLGDLVNGKIAYVNRQRGAGTRVLLDYELKRQGLNPEEINGYSREEYTHLAVAAAVASGSAEAGMAVQAAALALGMDFVPLYHERYDLAVPRSIFESAKFRELRTLLTDESFRARVQQMPGYDVTPMGQVVAEVTPA